MNDKIVYPFKKSDGFYRPCQKGCPNCTHCTDVFWDYSHDIYATMCEIHKMINRLDVVQIMKMTEHNQLQ